MTDKEIIDYIKKDIVEGNTADFLTLDIYDSDTHKKMSYSESFRDDMFKALFDFSLTKTIHAVAKESSSRVRAYNDTPWAIVNYEFIVTESTDGTTNITPRLMKFIEVAFTRWGLDKLAFPMGRNRIEYEFKEFSNGIPLVCPLRQEDPWQSLEAYMEEGDT